MHTGYQPGELPYTTLEPAGPSRQQDYPAPYYQPSFSHGYQAPHQPPPVQYHLQASSSYELQATPTATASVSHQTGDLSMLRQVYSKIG